LSFLLDTNVISETRKRVPDANVMSWFRETDEKDLYLSVLTLGEMQKGIARRRAADPQLAASLEHWLSGIEELFADRLIPIDAAVAKAWGEFQAGGPLPVIDTLLAATAKIHDMSLITQNIKDVATTGVSIINPWNHVA
jgi:predicted nucleic acid-binding protein